jgi:hypothetical protein
MSTAADDQPLPRRGRFKKKGAATRWVKEKGAATRLKKYLPLPRWYSKKCFDFRACEWFELELLLLIDLNC